MSGTSEDVLIIMVEDDPGHVTLIERNLRRAGIRNEVLQFGTGQAALDFFFGDPSFAESPRQSLVLLDLNLPDVDGYEVLSRLKSDERTQAIPIIVLTTTDNPREVDRCYQQGCNVYITKPVDYENFADAIKKLGFMLSVVKIPHIAP